MTEELSEGRLGELGELLNLRVEAGKPSSEEISLVMREIFPEKRNTLLDEHVGNGEKTLKELEEYKLDCQKNKNFPPLSRPRLCVSFLITNLYEALYEECWNISEECLSENQVRLFRFLYDFETGIAFSLARIVEAEEEIAGRAKDASARHVFKIGRKFGAPAVSQAEAYLNLTSTNAESKGLLIQDPSGFLLMDDSVERAKTGLSSDIVPSQAAEYISAGAKLAGDLYKELYKIAAPLYREKK